MSLRRKDFAERLPETLTDTGHLQVNFRLSLYCVREREVEMPNSQQVASPFHETRHIYLPFGSI